MDAGATRGEDPIPPLGSVGYAQGSSPAEPETRSGPAIDVGRRTTPLLLPRVLRADRAAGRDEVGPQRVLARAPAVPDMGERPHQASLHGPAHRPRGAG